MASSNTRAKFAATGGKTPDKRTAGKRKTRASSLDLDDQLEEILMEEEEPTPSKRAKKGKVGLQTLIGFVS